MSIWGKMQYIGEEFEASPETVFAVPEAVPSAAAGQGSQVISQSHLPSKYFFICFFTKYKKCPDECQLLTRGVCMAGCSGPPEELGLICH